MRHYNKASRRSVVRYPDKNIHLLISSRKNIYALHTVSFSFIDFTRWFSIIVDILNFKQLAKCQNQCTGRHPDCSILNYYIGMLNKINCWFFSNLTIRIVFITINRVVIQWTKKKKMNSQIGNLKRSICILMMIER